MTAFQVEVWVSGSWIPSGNKGLLNKLFSTQSSAKTAIKQFGSALLTYRAIKVNAELGSSYMVERKSGLSSRWFASGNVGLSSKVFGTEQEALDAVKRYGSPAVEYRAVKLEQPKLKQSKGEVKMAKRHTTRFIIEVKGAFEGAKYVRAKNPGLDGFFLTKEEALAAITPEAGLISPDVIYKVRQK